MPAFQSLAMMFENGFANAALYDFSEFATKLKLVEFKPSEPTGCAAAGAVSSPASQATTDPCSAGRTPAGTLIRHQ